MNKDIIFYSNFCTYSKEIINNISKTPINDNIIYVCVDDENITLPDFITAVPTIYLVNQKKIVVDEGISIWIKEKIAKFSQVKETGTNELQAYYGECSNSFGNSFSNIDNTENKPYISSFTFLGDEEKINTSNNDDNMGKSGLDLRMEQLQQQRSNEFSPIART